MKQQTVVQTKRQVSVLNGGRGRWAVASDGYNCCHLTQVLKVPPKNPSLLEVLLKNPH